MTMTTNSKNLRILLKSTKKTLRITADVLYIVMFVILIAYSFLNTTQFDMSWVKLLENEEGWRHVTFLVLTSPQLILYAIVLVQYLCSDDYNWKEYVLAFVLCVLMSRMPERNGSTNLLTYLLLIIGARNFSFQRLMIVYFTVASSITLMTVIGSQAGWVENLTYAEGGSAFGFVYSTDCAAHILFLALIYWCIRGKRIHYIEIAVLGLLGVMTWIGCKARFSAALFVLLLCVMSIFKVLLKKMGEDGCQKIFSGTLSAVLVTIPLLCNLVTHMLSILYTEDWGWMKALNTLVNGRLSLVWRGIAVYGFSLYGSNIPMIGGGGTRHRLNYYYIDSSYMQLSLLYGLVALGTIMLLMTLTCVKSRQAGSWTLLLVLIIVALHGIFEHHAFELAYSPFLLAAFAELKPRSIRRRKKNKMEAEKEQV